ncbi:MAG: hypothetical protein L6Q54_04595 [Leptospiraceae bacterium]|nr:hypothetical protein [Leptospiraceae bacterium]MCK6380514.1 hypothetical protein [Leptospiraceae bacterium]NUM41046.1 hypothetical protein [Leptospiraceae bacterium]
MKNLYQVTIFTFPVFLIFLNCSSLKVIKEPVLERTTVISEPICFSFFTICRESAFNSLVIKAVVSNESGERKYSLEYYLKRFEVEFPLGVSLGIDGEYYNLKRVSTEYSDYIKIGSELSLEVIEKILNSKKIILSYSNRVETMNIDFSNSDREKFIQNIKKVQENIQKTEKLTIIK